MQLIFLGPPGAGKGTQAQLIAQQQHIAHISTGEILREAIASKTDLGLQAKAYVDAGDLVPDELIIALMRNRLSQEDAARGWLLDGFPRNSSQAKALEQLLSILKQPYPQVIYFEVPNDVLVQRMLKRGRLDDSEATIRHRLDVYQAQTEPLIAYYQRSRALSVINGNQTIAEINRQLQSILSVPLTI